MKRLILFVFALMLCVGARAEESKGVTFPFGLTGFETLEQCGAVLSGYFGEGFPNPSDEYDFYRIECSESLYNMDLLNVTAAIKHGSHTVNLLAVSLVDTADLSGMNHLLDIVLFAYENYGQMFRSEPIRNDIDLNGNPRVYTTQEEMDQLLTAFNNGQPFTYLAEWMTVDDTYATIFQIKVESVGGDRFLTSLYWAKN